jgi:hypothetical protein
MRRILIAMLSLVAAVVLVAAPAEAQKAKAKKEFDKGVTAMDSHDYKTALGHFQAAYDAAPHWMVLGHIGNCQAKLNDPVNAIKAYEQFLKDGGDDIDAEQRTAARQNLEEQRRKVGVLHLLVKPKESTVSIDGDSYGNPPFEEILLKAGPHHIIVVRGEDEIEQDFTIEAGKEKTMKIYPKDDTVAAIVAPVPAPQPEPAPQPAPKTGPSLVEEDAAPYMDTAPEPKATPEPEPEPVAPPPPTEGLIKVAANIEGAAVELDGAAAGSVPFEQTVVSGDHQVVVTSEGYLPYTTTVTVTGGMASAVDVSLVSETEKPSRTNAGFIASAAVAGVGLVTGVIGWGIFGKNNATVNNYEDTMKSTQWSAWRVSNCETATKPDGTSASANDADWDYYCNELVITRNDAQDKSKVGLGLGIAGSVLFVAGGTMAALFFFKPELFFGAESDGNVTLVPVATNDQLGLVLGGEF